MDTLPPGVDEMVAIANVVQFIKQPEFSNFTRIIFDTAPTGHTLRLLTLPDFLDASVGACCLQLGFDVHKQQGGGHWAERHCWILTLSACHFAVLQI